MTIETVSAGVDLLNTVDAFQWAANKSAKVRNLEAQVSEAIGGVKDAKTNYYEALDPILMLRGLHTLNLDEYVDEAFPRHWTFAKRLQPLERDITREGLNDLRKYAQLIERSIGVVLLEFYLDHNQLPTSQADRLRWRNFLQKKIRTGSLVSHIDKIESETREILEQVTNLQRLHNRFQDILIRPHIHDAVSKRIPLILNALQAARANENCISSPHDVYFAAGEERNTAEHVFCVFRMHEADSSKVIQRAFLVEPQDALLGYSNEEQRRPLHQVPNPTVAAENRLVSTFGSTSLWKPAIRGIRNAGTKAKTTIRNYFTARAPVSHPLTTSESCSICEYLPKQWCEDSYILTAGPENHESKASSTRNKDEPLLAFYPVSQEEDQEIASGRFVDLTAFLAQQSSLPNTQSRHQLLAPVALSFVISDIPLADNLYFLLSTDNNQIVNSSAFILHRFTSSIPELDRHAKPRDRLTQDLEYLGLVLLQLCLGQSYRDRPDYSAAPNNLNEVTKKMLDEVQQEFGIETRQGIQHCFTADFTSSPSTTSNGVAFMAEFLNKVVKPLTIPYRFRFFSTVL